MVCIGCATYFAVLFNHVSVTRECEVLMVGSLCQDRVVFLVKRNFFMGPRVTRLYEPLVDGSVGPCLVIIIVIVVIVLVVVVALVIVVVVFVVVVVVIVVIFIIFVVICLVLDVDVV